MITVSHISKSFGDIKAVDDLSFSVSGGEIVGLLGPNGAGKSTTMRMMTGFLSPDKGTIEIDGINVSERTIEAQRHIGYLPENNPLYKTMLVSELLSFSAEIKGINRTELKSAFDFVVAATGIEKVFYRKVGELSKGYRQRVGMALALLHKPQVLILDEPTEGLDPNQRTEIRSLVKALAKDRTIIMSTHVMQEASAVCSRLLIINNGKLIADGTSEELSKMAQRYKVIALDVEGKDIELHLGKLDGVRDIEVHQTTPGRFRVTFKVDDASQVMPLISETARDNEWIIWQLAEQEHKLEDIFHTLTKEL
jgi:ABC-2 type transport system ATP-binding protein